MQAICGCMTNADERFTFVLFCNDKAPVYRQWHELIIGADGWMNS
jgi:hypothetical protein